MPSAHELLGFLAVVFAIWLLLKVTRVVMRLVLFTVGVLLFAGAVWWFFLR